MGARCRFAGAPTCAWSKRMAQIAADTGVSCSSTCSATHTIKLRNKDSGPSQPAIGAAHPQPTAQASAGPTMGSMSEQTVLDAGSAPRVRPLGRMPVAVPADIEDPTAPKASGVVRLPGHIAWSPPYEYDLEDRRDLRRLYARVMTEGLEADVRFYIDVDILVEVWDELYLSPHVRERWGDWLTERGLIS